MAGIHGCELVTSHSDYDAWREQKEAKTGRHGPGRGAEWWKPKWLLIAPSRCGLTSTDTQSTG